MKIFCHDPFEAAAQTGGATFEPGLGWWTQVADEDQTHLGVPFQSARDAIYIPTLQKSGEVVCETVVDDLLNAAWALGLTQTAQAAGMWILSETGQAQSETIWIVYSDDPVSDRAALRELAAQVKQHANQDAVAWEESGELHFTDFVPETILCTAPAVSGGPGKIDRLWIVPTADLETQTMQNLLRFQNQTILVSAQKWGARWDGLEDSILQVVAQHRLENPDVEIVGVKLEGSAPDSWNTSVIDRFSGVGNCPLETVARELGVELDQYQKLVVQNLKGRMQGLIEAGVERGMVDTIRLSDRCAQGSSPADEAAAVRAWENRTMVGDNLTMVHLPISRCASITDRFYGQYQDILITADDGETNFYGSADMARALRDAFPSYRTQSGHQADCWVRIVEDGSTESFWGGFVSPDSVVSFLKKHVGEGAA